MGIMEPIETVAINRYGCGVTVELTADIPSCCPVSKNPFEGSTITICYQPAHRSIEIGAFKATLWQYRGGLYDDEGQLLVRNMEDMICHIAGRCANAVGVQVEARARLCLLPEEIMVLKVTRKPAEHEH